MRVIYASYVTDTVISFESKLPLLRRWPRALPPPLPGTPGSHSMFAGALPERCDDHRT